MLFDGLKLVEQSKAVNLTVDSGVAFPTNPNRGELFFLSTDSTLYSHTGTEWVKFLTIRDMVYDIVLSYPSDVSTDEEIMVFLVQRPMKMLADNTGSLYSGYAISTSTTSSVFSVRKNNVEFGTITFPANENLPFFDFPNETVFVAGDRITIVSPSTPPHGKLTIGMKAVLT
jgi:hypothetical protein